MRPVPEVGILKDKVFNWYFLHCQINVSVMSLYNFKIINNNDHVCF